MSRCIHNLFIPMFGVFMFWNNYKSENNIYNFKLLENIQNQILNASKSLKKILI